MFTQFKFFGIDDVETIKMKWADVLQGEEKDKAINSIMELVKKKNVFFKT